MVNYFDIYWPEGLIYNLEESVSAAVIYQVTLRKNAVMNLRLQFSFFYEGGIAEGAIEDADGGGDGGPCAPVVTFDDAVVAFDGFSVTGIPHILDSVVLTGLSLDAGLLGLHIASFCAGVNVLAFT